MDIYELEPIGLPRKLITIRKTFDIQPFDIDKVNFLVKWKELDQREKNKTDKTKSRVVGM